MRPQDDFRAFRRQLDDKRPLIEQSIMTSRQLVANEPALSDTSDSEGSLHVLSRKSTGNNQIGMSYETNRIISFGSKYQRKFKK